MTQSYNRKLAGIEVTVTPIINKAIEHIQTSCEPYIVNHVMRSWLFANYLGALKGIVFDAEVLALSTLLHDITLNEKFAGPRRFEVEGADIARRFATENGVHGRRAQLIWDGVALNSTPSIGLYKEAEVALCTAGICLDVVGLQYEMVPAAKVKSIVDRFPRLRMKEQMTRCFCGMARNHPETSYDNFLRDFGERYVPDFNAPSSVDLVRNSPFDE